MSRKRPDQRTLDAREQRFVGEYLIDLDPQRAALAAGYSASMAASKAFSWVGNGKLKPHVYAAIRAAMEKRSARTMITQDAVLRRLWDIATADPNELIQHRRVNCRHCYGIGHEHQWIDQAEYDRTCREIEKATPDGQEPVYPELLGGAGFDATLTPHAKCPKCSGEGHGKIHALDTRHLSRAAQALYAGVKATKDGFEIKMHDQLAALTLLAKHVGIANDKIKLGTEEGDPLRAFLLSFQGTKLAPVEKPGRHPEDHL